VFTADTKQKRLSQTGQADAAIMPHHFFLDVKRFVHSLRVDVLSQEEITVLSFRNLQVCVC